MAMLPTDKHALTGFRVVQSDFTPTPTLHQTDLPLPLHQVAVSQVNKTDWQSTETAIFRQPSVYVVRPTCGSSTPFSVIITSQLLLGATMAIC